MCLICLSVTSVRLYHFICFVCVRPLTLYSPVVTICTASLTYSNSTFCSHSVFMCFMWIWEQTAIISLLSINWLVFITEKECVYCAVRTESIYNSTFCPHSVFMCFVWISEQTAIISLYNINWLVFITETESVYCAVRTEYLIIILVNTAGAHPTMHRTACQGSISTANATGNLCIPHVLDSNPGPATHYSQDFMFPFKRIWQNLKLGHVHVLQIRSSQNTLEFDAIQY